MARVKRRRGRGFFILLLLIGGFSAAHYYDVLPPSISDPINEFIAENFPSQEEIADDVTQSDDDDSDSDSHESSPSRPHRSSDNVEDATAAGTLGKEPSNKYRKIDKHARAAPSSAEASVPTLASYLAEGTSNDLEKARAIYVWLTDNVKYDDRGFNTGDYGDLSPEGVLKSRSGVCSGYAQLYEALGNEMGLEIANVSGYSKGYGYTPGEAMEISHAWTAITIGGKVHLFDATWGAGYGETVNGKLKSSKKYTDVWFDTDPYVFFFSHYPEKIKYQGLSESVPINVFEKLPECSASAIFEYGFDAKSIYNQLRAGTLKVLPETYGCDYYVQVKNMPVSKFLDKNRVYEFEIFVPKTTTIAIISESNQWTEVQGKEGVFNVSYTPEELGELNIAVKTKKAWSTFLKYKVRNNPNSVS
jgi:transglutaminase-like putative cysteine protease